MSSYVAVNFQNMITLPHGDMCIPVEPFVACEIIWPGSDGGDCACSCGTIRMCNCINSTGYTVDIPSLTASEIEICWRNLTENENLTRVFVIKETQYIPENNTASNTIGTRIYISAYIAIIAGM